LGVVHRSVHLDDQTGRRHEKIHDVGANRMLTPEVYPLKGPAARRFPELCFCRGRFLAHAPGSTHQLLPIPDVAVPRHRSLPSTLLVPIVRAVVRLRSVALPDLASRGRIKAAPPRLRGGAARRAGWGGVRPDNGASPRHEQPAFAVNPKS
jgi:hypothetical protein